MFLLLIFIGVALGQEICPVGELYWLHPDCTLYYACDNGNPRLKACPNGLYWKQETYSCDFPQNVPECEGGTRDPGHTTVAVTTTTPTTTKPTTTPTTTRTTTTPTTTKPTTTPTTTRTTTTPTTTRPTTTVTTQRTTSKNPDTEGTQGPSTLPPGVCPPEGVHKIAHETQCDWYYICVNGVRQSQVFECAEGLSFDPVISECNVAAEVSCVSITTTISTLPECPSTGIWQLPYPGNCTMYILCIDEAATIYKCPQGMIFDEVEFECKPEDVAVCTQTVIATFDNVILDKQGEEVFTMTFWRSFVDKIRMISKTLI